METKDYQSKVSLSERVYLRRYDLETGELLKFDFWDPWDDAKENMKMNAKRMLQNREPWFGNYNLKVIKENDTEIWLQNELVRIELEVSKVGIYNPLKH